MGRRLLWSYCLLILTVPAWPLEGWAEEFGMGHRPPTPEEQAYIDAVYTEVFTVEPNELSRRRSRAEWEPARRAGTQAPLAAERPSAVDNSILPYFPPIRSQGGQSSCTAWASCYYYNTYTQAMDEGIDVSGGDDDYISSPAFMYPLINGGNNGPANTSYAVARLSDIGCCSWSLKPYSSSDYTSWPSEAAWIEALKRRTLGACTINGSTPEGLEAVKQHLANGHVAVTGFFIYDNWSYPGPVPGIDNAVYYCPTGEDRGGGHAVTFVGYDDNRSYVDHRDGNTYRGAFLLANSWGTGWGVPNSTGAGTKGFFWAAYRMFPEWTFGPHAFFTYDRDDYRPTVYAVVGVNHAERGHVRLSSGVGSPTWPDDVSRPAIDYHGGTELGIDDSQRIAIDMTDFLALIPSDGAANLYVEVDLTDAATSSGTITSADFFTDFDRDGTYEVVSSGDPTVTVAAGSSEYACAVSSGAAGWYVDDSNQMGPWDGSRDHPYASIQSAVAASSAGDLVLVAPGVYPESLAVDRDCTIDGSGAPRTILEPAAGGPAVSVASGAGLTVRQLTVRGTAAPGVDGIDVTNGSAHVTQSEIHECDRGLTIGGAGSYLSVTETTVLDCTVGLEANAGTTEVSRCTFSANGDGIRLRAAATIENSIVSGSSISGIWKHSSSDVPAPDVRFCDLWNNGTDCVYFEPAASCFSADPLFFDPGNGYYCLGYGSPCVNVGTSDGSNPDGSTDIGAHAAVTVGTPAADFQNLQPAVDAVSHNGTVASVLVAPGVYTGWCGRVTMRGPVALIGESPTSVALDGTGYCCGTIRVLSGAAGGALSGFTILNQSWSGVSLGIRSPDGTRVPFLIRNNIIRDNEDSGIWVALDSSPVVVSNTIANNGDDGVWVHSDCTSLSLPWIENNIITGNGASGIADSVNNETMAWSDYNDLYENGADYYGVDPGLHDFAVDPGFVDAAGHDYHLQRCSPCLDAGNPAADYSREPQPNGRRANLGAYGNTPEAQRSASFGDAPCGHWAFEYVEACYNAGIVGGYGDGLYHPTDPVSRDQMSVFIARAMAGGDSNVPDGPEGATFNDVPTDHWAYEYVEYCVAEGVVQGFDPVTYAPTVIVARDAMAVFISRAIAGGDENVPDGPAEATFDDVPTYHWAYKYVEYCVAEDVVQGYTPTIYEPLVNVNREQMAVFVARAFDLLP
jgi:parallel beta-helix repeat protein